MAWSGQCREVGCCWLPSVIPSLHQKPEIKTSVHNPHRNNMDPPLPEITTPLKKIAFA